jgi:hypothetical protein
MITLDSKITRAVFLAVRLSVENGFGGLIQFWSVFLDSDSNIECIRVPQKKRMRCL